MRPKRSAFSWLAVISTIKKCCEWFRTIQQVLVTFSDPRRHLNVDNFTTAELQALGLQMNTIDLDQFAVHLQLPLFELDQLSVVSWIRPRPDRFGTSVQSSVRLQCVIQRNFATPALPEHLIFRRSFTLCPFASNFSGDNQFWIQINGQNVLNSSPARHETCTLALVYVRVLLFVRN